MTDYKGTEYKETDLASLISMYNLNVIWKNEYSVQLTSTFVLTLYVFVIIMC